MTSLRRALCMCGIAGILLFVIAAPTDARIVKTKRPSPGAAGMGVLIGSGFEYQSDAEVTEYGLPFLFEWAVTPNIVLNAEPVFIAIRSNDGSIRGFDDLESTVTVDLVSERRYRPAFALAGGVKWPTATDEEIGTGLTDYSLGALLSKEWVQAEFGFNAIYSQVGIPSAGLVQNTIQVSTAIEWHLRPSLDLTCEVLTTQGVGPLRGRPGIPTDPATMGINVPGGEFELTLGMSQYIGRRLKFEQAVIVQTDGALQAEVAWEWDFGEGR